MAPSEHQLQTAFFDWAKMHLRARRAYAVPNGGQRNIVVASKLKAEGVRKGVLDIHLPIACGGANGLWIEFKAGKNKLTLEQALEADTLLADGFAVAVCWDTLGAIDITQRYLAGEVGPVLLFWR
jgi:hypothetical protein